MAEGLGLYNSSLSRLVILHSLRWREHPKISLAQTSNLPSKKRQDDPFSGSTGSLLRLNMVMLGKVALANSWRTGGAAQRTATDAVQRNE